MDRKRSGRDALITAPAAEAPIAVPSCSSKWWRKSQLIIYTVLLLLASVGNTVYFKRMTSAMPNYGFFLTQLSTVIYIPFFLVLAGRPVASVGYSYIQKFMVMGVFDGFAGTFMLLGGLHTSGTSQVLLQQGVIPITMLMSFLFIGKRYHLLQHTGAATIVFGIVLAKVAVQGGAKGGDNQALFNFVFFMSMVPTAASSVFKEVAFRGFDGDLDVNVLQFWVAMFQCIVNLLAMPIYTLSFLGPQQVPLRAIPAQSIGGSMCLFFMENQVVSQCSDIGLDGMRPCDHCSAAWQSVVLYLLFNLSYNICTMLVIKHGSAALSFLVSTLRMPLSSLAFSSSLIMGREAVSMSFGDILSLVVIIVGLLCFRYGGQRMKKQSRLEQEALRAMGASPNGPMPSPTSPQFMSPQYSPQTPSANQGPSPKQLARPSGFVHVFTTAGLPNVQPVFAYVPAYVPRLKPRSPDRLRSDLYRRLGAASPLNSPQLRAGSKPDGNTAEASTDDLMTGTQSARFALSGLDSAEATPKGSKEKP